MENKSYLFSVIMAVYNVEPWLREAVDSIIAQDFGFENVQLILVDDGSTDQSGQICDDYAVKYPQNVVVVHKENGGSSSARNAGVSLATGKYLNFCDPDDILQSNALSCVSRFIECHGDETDVIAIPVFLFGDMKGPHSLNGKFKEGTRVIDLNMEWKTVQLSLAAAFVKTDVAKAYAFEEDVRMPSAEDARELVKILPRKQTLGIVADTKYLYRKRGGSQLSNISHKKSYYTEYIEQFPLWAVDYCLKEYGYVPKSVMYTLMYDLQWQIRLDKIPEGLLSEDEEAAYEKHLTHILKHIDDEVILAQSAIYTEQKSYLCSLKYGSMPSRYRYGNTFLYGYGNNLYFDISKVTLHLCFFDITDRNIVVQAWCPKFIHYDGDAFDVYATVNGVNSQKYPAVILYEAPGRYSAGNPVYNKVFLQFEIPVTEMKTSYTVRFFRGIDGLEIQYTNIALEKYFPVSRQYQNAYYSLQGYILEGRPNGIMVSKRTRPLVWHELRFLKEVWRKNRVGGRKAVFLRLFAHIGRKLLRKPLWLIADKSDRADDNGEAFFAYCRAHKRKEVNSIFLVSKDSADYQRLKKIGPVIPYMSWRHKALYLLANKIISAYSHDELNNPFLNYNEHYRDLLQKCQYIFLQHGIIKDDLSQGLNKYHKNIKMFVCSVKAEWESVVTNPAYGYSDHEVVCTGLPRYDRLYDSQEKEIIIMPTWRRHLMGAYHSEDSRWDLLPGFEDSSYYQFYYGLLHSQKLREAAEKNGYTVNFLPHPVMFPYLERFDVPDYVAWKGPVVTYRDEFARNQLQITDYSSTAFDFAYLRKPVIYAHFDSNHYAEGYFDYERDGFGEVEYDLESTVDRIIEYMENDCRLKDKYRQRIDGFFAFNDRNNCQRVYEKLMQLQERSGKKC